MWKIILIFIYVTIAPELRILMKLWRWHCENVVLTVISCEKTKIARKGTDNTTEMTMLLFRSQVNWNASGSSVSSSCLNTDMLKMGGYKRTGWDNWRYIFHTSSNSLV